MKINVILKKGAVGEIKPVSRGYARYLIAQDKAIPATNANKQQFAHTRSDLEQKEKQAIQEAKERVGKLQEANIRIKARAADSNHLYGSLRTKEIADAVSQTGILLKKEEIKLNNPIRSLGEHQVNVVLHDQVSVTLTITVEPLNV